MTSPPLTRADLRVLDVLWQLAAHHARTWCYPNQATLLRLLRRFHARHMSRRTLNRHLHALERDGYIHRIRRHHRSPTGQLVLRSTVYTFLRRAQVYIARAAQATQRLARTGAKWLTHIAVTFLAQSGTPSLGPASAEGAETAPAPSREARKPLSTAARAAIDAAGALLKSRPARKPFE